MSASFEYLYVLQIIRLSTHLKTRNTDMIELFLMLNPDIWSLKCENYYHNEI